MALGVVAELAEVEHDARFVADRLGIVTRRNRDDVARPDFVLGAVVHLDAHPAGPGFTFSDHLQPGLYASFL